MANLDTLNDIRTGAATAGQAMETISSLFDRLDADLSQRIFSALRAWVWKALDQRRRDDELREWYVVFRKVEAVLAKQYLRMSERVAVLRELVYESISVSETKSPTEVMGKRHVAMAVALLGERTDGSMSRSELGRLLDLRQANTTRVINLLLSAKLVDRVTRGREVHVELTRLGHSVARASSSTSDNSIRPVYDGEPSYAPRYLVRLPKGATMEIIADASQSVRLRGTVATTIGSIHNGRGRIASIDPIHDRLAPARGMVVARKGAGAPSPVGGMGIDKAPEEHAFAEPALLTIA